MEDDLNMAVSTRIALKTGALSAVFCAAAARRRQELLFA